LDREQPHAEIAELEEKLKATERALVRAEQQAVAGRFAAVMMHEINNPLEAITNLVYLFKAKTEPLTEDAADYLGLIEEQLTRIAAVTRQALSFNRVSMRPTKADLVEILGIAIRTYSRGIFEKQLRVELDVPETAHCDVYPGELTQAFSNLISNAVEASGRGGKIHIRVRSRAGRHDITICDFGSGVPAAMRKTLFKAFATGKETGNGLGLWVCSKIVEKHGGRILWRSSTRPEKHGTAFRISLGTVGGGISTPELALQ
jgi:two-component system, NtrC family, sensor kinase